jgi:uncharacterized protein (DUF2267 family)
VTSRVQDPTAGSDARKRLLDAAARAGVAEPQAPLVVRGVLSCFADYLPDGERRHLLSHLPGDVRSMLEAQIGLGNADLRRSLPDFALLISTGAIDVVTAVRAVRPVLGELGALVPGEVADVAAVLPADLRELWEATAAPV